MKKFAFPMLLLALIAAPVAMRAFAKDDPAKIDVAGGTKTVAVLAITSYDELIKDIAVLGELTGNAGAEQQLEGLLGFFTQGQGLKGLDKTRPCGATLQVVGNEDDLKPQPLIFLPVKSLNDLAGVLGEVEDKGDGVVSLQVAGQEVFAKEKSGWAFIGQTAESLSSLPADPVKLLAGLNPQYDIAIKLNLQNIPQMYRTMIVDQIKAGVEQNTAQQPGEDDDAYASRKKAMDAQVEQTVTLINETKDVTVGWKIDREKKSTFLDFRLAAISGSKTARQMSQMQEMPSDFSGFIDSAAAACLSFVASVPTQDVAQQLTQLQSYRESVLAQVEKNNSDDPAVKKELKSAIGDLFDSMIATMKSGKMDGGVSVSLGAKEMSVVAGVLVANTAKLEESFKKLISVTAEKDKKFPAVKFDAVKYKDVRFHTTSFPIEQGEDIQKVVGDKLDVAVGFGAKQVYFAVGTDSIAKVKAAIDKSASGAGKKYPPAQLTLAFAPIMKFVATVTPNARVSAMAAQLAESAGKDHVVIAVRPVGMDGSVTYRVTAEEGILKLLGEVNKQVGPGAGG